MTDQRWRTKSASKCYEFSQTKKDLSILHFLPVKFHVHMTTAEIAYYKDTRNNLCVVSSDYKEQLNLLEKWQDKNVVLFAFGDYEYICRMLGISGASGRYPCVWCLIHNQDMRKPPEERDPIQPRTPEHMEEQLQNFLNEGNGDLKKAKDYFNVIHEPLLDIPSDRICVPGLHISIGLFLKFYNLFMTECESLDILIAKHKAKTSGKPTGDTDFDQYVKTLHSAERHREKARKLREQAKQAQEHITFKITNDGLQCDEEYVHPYLTGLVKLVGNLSKRAEN
ncbi:uncharacterized protein LOC5501787 [Nematostella vectensis]|uniref:uncharacterized protein LOC5501787 n=1 Tax=Nematostella vectensis TaxID=45351 RepID=UPI00207739A7|nr:uncharacterized protein LOC5501787 [Nematostella vectensis]